MLGYFSDPGLTAARTSDGFFRTGDYCEVTADGMLKYLGRKKDVFNTPDGSNIHPAHIEQLILDFDWVRQAALVGDGEPFLVALLVVAGVPAAAANVTGYLDPPAHAALYARAAADLAALNRTLARNEQVRRFALFDRPMPGEDRTQPKGDPAPLPRRARAALLRRRAAARDGAQPGRSLTLPGTIENTVNA
jgi:long-chain acyl-CoA synthetase